MLSVSVSRPQPLSPARQIWMNVYWFSINMMWASIFLIILPYHIQALVGVADKGKVLGLVLALGAVVSILAAPIFRVLSEHVSLPGGRRKPWIVLGTLAVLPTLWAFSHLTQARDAQSLFAWIVTFLLLQFFSNAAAAPCGALISDQVLAERRGWSPDWSGLMTMLGIVAGAVTGFLIVPLGISSIFNILMVVMLIGPLLTIFCTHETNPLLRTSRIVLSEFLSSLHLPFKDADFTRMFFNRLLIGMGLFTIQEFILYYMTDAFNAPYIIFGQVTTQPEAATSIFFLAVFLGAIAASLIVGTLSKVYSRKQIAYAASLMFGFTCMVFTFSRSFSLSIFMGIVFGMGYGAYDRVAWNMASDVLPSIRKYGKNMGIWHIAVVLPQVIATPISGFLLDHFQKTGATQNIHQMGYIVIFVVAVVYFTLGSIFLRKIKGLR